MITGARYAHTNLVARDWRRLVSFYRDLFGCEPVPPERDLAGPDIEAGTAIPGAHIRGAHLRLPGYGPSGPTLEIFQYDPAGEGKPGSVNRPGFGHIAFAVNDVPAARGTVCAAGGSPVGEMVTVQIVGGGRVTWCYVRDPEGNIIELQAWENPGAGDHAGSGS